MLVRANQNNKAIRRRPRKRDAVTRDILAFDKLASLACHFPKSLHQGRPFPIRQFSTIKYIAKDVLQDSVNSWTFIDCKINDFYNFFPSLLPPGVQLGYQALITIYAINIVWKFRFRLTAVANEPAHAVSLFMGFSDTQPAPASLDDLLCFASRTPATKILTVGQTTGMSRASTEWIEFYVPAVTGNPISYIGSQAFYGTPNVSPTQLVYGIIGAFNDLSTALTNGVQFVLEAELSGMFSSQLNKY